VYLAYPLFNEFDGEELTVEMRDRGTRFIHAPAMLKARFLRRARVKSKRGATAPHCVGIAHRLASES